MNEYNTDFERRLRAVENKNFPPQKTLVFNEEDLIINANEYSLKFTATKNTEVIIDVEFNIEQQTSLELFLNGVKITAYKPVIGKNRLVTKATCQNSATLKAKFDDILPIDIKIYISGYIEDFPYGGTTEILRCVGNIYVCVFDELKSVATVYKIGSSSLEKICSTGSVKSVAISQSNIGLFNLYRVTDDGKLEVSSVSQEENLTFNEIDTDVRKVSGALFDNTGGCFYIKNNVVYSAKTVDGEWQITNYDIKNAYDIKSTPSYSEAFIVIGYDKNSTLYVK